MGVRVFISSSSGNQKIETEQHTICSVLQSRKIDFVTIDIMVPGNQKLRTFMRERGKKKEGARNVIPPQIFNGEEFRGDFDDFDIANEDDLLEEFLGLERKNPKVAPVKTGAVAEEVHRLAVGKLLKEADIIELGPPEEYQDASSLQFTAEKYLEDVASLCDCLNVLNYVTISGCMIFCDDITVCDNVTVKEFIPECVSETVSEFYSDDGEEKAFEENDSGIEMQDDKTEEDDEVEDEVDTSDHDQDEAICVEKTEDKDNEDEDIKVEEIELNTDLTDNNIDDENEIISKDMSDSETESDFTDSEDDTVEYMEDGEVMRKCRRGFRQVINCKRFWKATHNL